MKSTKSYCLEELNSWLNQENGIDELSSLDSVYGEHGRELKNLLTQIKMNADTLNRLEIERESNE